MHANPLPPGPRRSRSRRVAAGAVAATLLTGSALAPAALAVGLAGPAAAAIVDAPVTHSAPDAPFTLDPVGTYETGVFDESAAEIVAYHAATQRLFVVNAQSGSVDVLDAADPTAPTLLYTIEAAGVVANSVAIRPDGLGVVALESTTKTDDGQVLFFDATADAATVLGTVDVGPLPDMVTVSADGAYAVVANEGEPADDYSVDPAGSVSVVSLPDELSAPAQEAVRTADFSAFDAPDALPEGVRVFGPEVGDPATRVSRNLEPEYVALDGATAYVTLQENNAIAVVDLDTAEVTAIHALGAKDHGVAGNELDPSDRDPEDAPTFDQRTVEGLRGLYMPDGVAAYRSGGETYLVTANEGDAREWGDYEEPARVKNLGEDGVAPICADSPLADLTGDADLGRLNVSTASGLTDAGCYDELYAFGARSFSIWATDGTQVFDSGAELEQITHDAAPEFFNSNHSESNLEGRSDDKGPEPESVTVGEVDGRTYAFVGLERVGGIAVYDVTEPTASEFVTYVNNRDFSVSVEDDGVESLSAAGDLGPEGLTFIPGADSPTGEPMLAVGNEVSGTTTLFALEPTAADDEVDLQILGINDFHGRIEADGSSAGAAVLAGAVDQLRGENANTLFVSAGDNIGASTFTSFSQQDTPTLEALQAAGLDVSAVGNHEFDRGFDDLVDRVIPEGAFPQLGANVYESGTTNPVLDEYWLTEVDGVSVGFVGVVTPMTASMVSPSGIAGIEFGNMLEAANRVAGELSDGDPANGEADVVVLLAHDGPQTSDCAAIATEDSPFGELVRDADPAIAAIFSGHTHLEFTCSTPVDGWAAGLERPVIQTGQYGENLGRVQLTVDRETGAVTAATADLLPLTTEDADGEDVPLYPADPEVAAIVAAAVAAAEEVGAQVVGQITADITRAFTPEGDEDRGSESSLGNLVADMQLWATSNDDFAGEPAQIAFMNPGGVRADLIHTGDGSVTYRDVASVQPFANTLVTMDLTGAQIKAVLEEQWQPEGASRPKLHLGVSEGFSYTYDPDAPRGERIVSMTLDGTAIDPAATYRVVANSFLASGGDNFTTFTQGTNVTDTGQVDLSASVAYFEAFGTVDPAPLGRAMLASEVPGGDGPGDDDGNGSGDDNGSGDGNGSGDDDGSGAGSGGGGLAVTGAGLGLLVALALALAVGGVLLTRARVRA